ncbi:MAG: formylglycine-generating enzyme family protein [bacterium]|nr:formylglycine-generating enzyme family protein [bacterium]
MLHRCSQSRINKQPAAIGGGLLVVCLRIAILCVIVLMQGCSGKVDGDGGGASPNEVLEMMNKALLAGDKAMYMDCYYAESSEQKEFCEAEYEALQAILRLHELIWDRYGRNLEDPLGEDPAWLFMSRSGLLFRTEYEYGFVVPEFSNPKWYESVAIRIKDDHAVGDDGSCLMPFVRKHGRWYLHLTQKRALRDKDVFRSWVKSIPPVIAAARKKPDMTIAELKRRVVYRIWYGAGCEDGHAKESTEIQRQAAESLGVPVNDTLDLGKGVTMKLAFVPAGKFLMGSSKTDPLGEVNERPRHEVTISKPFYMGVYEVTQAQWRAVMGTEPWDDKFGAKSGDNNTANYISWDDASRFCKLLSEKSGKKVSLPSEAQWEYACRGGSKMAYCFSDVVSKIGDYAWYRDNYNEKEDYARPVGQKKANAFGLYDMHGNVWEWCRDWFDEKAYAKAKDVDPENTREGSVRVIRGGSWDSPPRNCRAAYRLRIIPAVYNCYRGFRVIVVCGVN